jgi:hypothetical protein
MSKIKTFSATVLLFAAVAAPVFAHEPGIHSRMGNSESFVSNSGMTEPGDFAVTGGLSNRSRAWNPTGQVDPGTSNSPAGNAGGE